VRFAFRSPSGAIIVFSMPTTPYSHLFSPWRLGDLGLPNRFVMAPLTRCFAAKGLVPSPASVAYYARRAEAGLILSEATIIRPDGQGYPDTPGIFTMAQVDGWKRVLAAVHGAGGRMALQAWHVGRVSHSRYHGGVLPVAPSAVAAKGRVSRITPPTEYETPRALEDREITQIIRDYAVAARNGREAGFDAIEIHGAHNYLIEQFLRADSNRRTDAWGGSAEKRARFALEVIDATLEHWPASHVGIRLTPGVAGSGEISEQDNIAYEIVLEAIRRHGLAWVHMGGYDYDMVFENLGTTAHAWLRARTITTLMGVGSLDAAKAERALAAGEIDLAVIGRPFIANPDFVGRVRTGQPLREYDAEMLKELV
jgi:2,4-dienoyl-CoA reductase-like NADH-dependent reductase (Old Yellow Enzyme family)